MKNHFLDKGRSERIQLCNVVYRVARIALCQNSKRRNPCSGDDQFAGHNIWVDRNWHFRTVSIAPWEQTIGVPTYVSVNTVAQRIDEGADKEIAVVSMVNIDHCAFMSLSFNEGHELSYYADVALGEGFFLAVSLPAVNHSFY